MLINAASNTEEVIDKANKLIQSIENLIPSVVQFALNMIVAIIIFIVGKIVIKIVLKILNKFFERTKVEISVQKFLNSLTKAVLYVVLVMIICGQIGIETSSLIAVIGSAGLALGLALQGSLSNFAGGVLILVLKPFKVGDYIVDGSSGKEGTVRRIDLFYTYLNTADNKKLIIPNGSLANTHIINSSSNDTRRVDFEIGISYSADIDIAKRVITETAKAEEKILKNEEVFVFIKELAASQVTVGVRVWVRTEDYWTVYFALNEAFKKALDRENIEIPFNQLSVHIEEKK